MNVFFADETELASGQADFAEKDGFVLRRGKLFQAGDYPAKRFSLTEAEMQAGIAGDAPLPMNHEHRPHPHLDGALGEIRKRWMEGESLFAEFAVPKWLDAQARAKGIPLKVSAEWDRKSKRLLGAAWTLAPHLTDAGLLAAFSEATGTEINAVPPTGADAWNEKRAKKVAHFHRARKGPPMKVKELWKNMIAKLHGEGAIDEATAAQFNNDVEALPDTEFAGADRAAFAAAQTEIARQAELIAELQGKNRLTEAQAFAEAEIEARRALPSERDYIVAAFAQAQADDAANPTKVTFSDGSGKAVEGSRVNALKALFAARSAHQLFDELLKEQDLVALGNKLTTAQFGTDREPDEKRTDALLNRTEVGRKAQAVVRK